LLPKGAAAFLPASSREAIPELMYPKDFYPQRLKPGMYRDSTAGIHPPQPAQKAARVGDPVNACSTPLQDTTLELL